MPTRTLDNQSGNRENSEVVKFQLCTEHIDLDTSEKACKRFGYTHGDRVRFSLDGIRFQYATVIGVKDKKLYFHIDGQDGAMCFPKLKKSRHFRNEGFQLISEGNKGSQGDIKYKLCAEHIDLDTSEKACKRFGYLHGNRVQFSLDGRIFQQATVIGVKDGKLYFHINGQDGVMYFPKLKKPRHFKNEGFELISEEISRGIQTAVGPAIMPPAAPQPQPQPAPPAAPPIAPPAPQPAPPVGPPIAPPAPQPQPASPPPISKLPTSMQPTGAPTTPAAQSQTAASPAGLPPIPKLPATTQPTKSPATPATQPQPATPSAGAPPIPKLPATTQPTKSPATPATQPQPATPSAGAPPIPKLPATI